MFCIFIIACLPLLCVHKKYVNTRKILYISLGRERKKVGWKRKNNNFCLYIDKNWGISMASLLKHIHRIHTLTKLALDHVFYITKNIFCVFLCYQQTIQQHSAFGAWPENIDFVFSRPVLLIFYKWKTSSNWF